MIGYPGNTASLQAVSHDADEEEMAPSLDRHWWWLLILVAAALGLGFAFDDALNPIYPRRFGWWVAASALIGGILLGLRAWWLVIAGTTAFSASVLVLATVDPVGGSNAEDQRGLVVLLVFGLPLLFVIPVAAGAGIKWLLRRRSM